MRRNFNRPPRTSDYNEKNNPDYVRQQRSLFKERGIFENRGGGRDAYLAGVNANLEEARQELRSQGGSPEGLTILATFQNLATAQDSLTTEKVLAAKRMLEEVKASGGKSGSMEWTRPLEKAAAVLLLITSVLGIGGEAFAATQVEANQDTKRKTERKLTPADQEEYNQQLAENTGMSKNFTLYNVKKGDTLSEIVEKFLRKDLGRKPTREEREEALTKTALANGIRYINEIQKGKTIVVPSFKTETEAKPAESIPSKPEAKVDEVKPAEAEAKAVEVKAPSEIRYDVKKSWRGEGGINKALAEIFPGLFTTYKLTATEKELRTMVMRESGFTAQADIKDANHLSVSAAAQQLKEKALLERTKANLDEQFARYLKGNPGEEMDKATTDAFEEAIRGMSPERMDAFAKVLKERLKAETNLITLKSEIPAIIERAAYEFRLWESAAGKAPAGETSEATEEGEKMKTYLDNETLAWLKKPNKNLPAGLNLYVDALNTVAKPAILKQEIKKLREKLRDEKNPNHAALQKQLEELLQQLAVAEKAAEGVNPAAILVNGLPAFIASLNRQNLGTRVYLSKLSAYFQAFDQLPVNRNILKEIRNLVATSELRDTLISIAQNNTGKNFDLQAALLGNDIFKMLPVAMQREIAEALGEKNPYSTQGMLVNEASAAWGKYSPSLKGLDFTNFSRKSKELGIFFGYLKQAFGKTKFLDKAEKPKAIEELALIEKEMENEATYKAALQKLEALLEKIAQLEAKTWETTWVKTYGGSVGENGTGQIRFGVERPNLKESANLEASKNRISAEVGKGRWRMKSTLEALTGFDASAMFRVFKTESDDGESSAEGSIGLRLRGFAKLAALPITAAIDFLSGIGTGDYSFDLPFANLRFRNKEGGLFNQKDPNVTDTDKLNASRERLGKKAKNGGFSATVIENILRQEGNRIGFALANGNQPEVTIGRTEYFDKNHAINIDLREKTAEERTAIITTLAKYMKLPENFQAQGMEGLQISFTVGAEHERKHEHQRFLDMLAGGMGITLHFADGSQLKLSASAFDLDKTKWHNNGDGTESMVTGGKATEVEIRWEKVLEDLGFTGIASISVRHSQADGFAREEKIVFKTGIKREGFEVTVGTDGTVNVSYKLPDGTEFFGFFDATGKLVFGFKKTSSSVEITGNGIFDGLCYPADNTPIDVKTIKAKGGLDMKKAPGLTLQQMDEVRAVIGETVTVAKAPTTNNTADNLNIDSTDAGSTVVANQASTTAKCKISDLVNDGFNDTNVDLINNPANWKVRYKPVGPGAWTEKDIISVSIDRTTGIITYTFNSQGGINPTDMIEIINVVPIGGKATGSPFVETSSS